MIKRLRSKWRKLRPNDDLRMQDNIIYLDTETNIDYDKDGNETQTLKLGWGIHTRNGEKPDYFFFTDVRCFWDWLFSKLDRDNMKLIVFAHNMDFDFKIIDGYNQMLKKKDWSVKNMYVKGCTFILKTESFKQEILFVDSMNYTPMALKKLGEAIGLNKMEVDFNKCTFDELKEYCLNDTEILYRYMESLMKFLSDNNLTRLKNTSASLSMNSFKHRFYDFKDHPIFLHDHEDAIRLERDSYRGGITDCFQIGKFVKTLFKLDINSQYGSRMHKFSLPIKLIYHKFENISLDELKKHMKTFKVIINADIWLPKDKAYILSTQKVNKMNKSVFLHGRFNVSICSPEIEFVLKHGKILKIHEVNMYEHYRVFKDYIDFFYNKRLEYKDNGDEVGSLFVKMMLNSIYGKFGSYRIDFNVLNPLDAKQEIDNLDLKEGDISETELFENEIHYRIMQMGDTIIKTTKTTDNASDTMVGIPSFITSHARMYLVELILKAGRKNVFYCDTDSLILNKKGFDNLKDYIDDRKLGMLKLEGVSNDTTIIRPKYYTFDGENKCKGVKKQSWIFHDNDIELKILQKQFIRHKTAIKKDLYDAQYVHWSIKRMSKTYDKGIVKDGIVSPYTLKQLI